MLTQIWPRIAGSPGKVVLTNPTDAELVEACLSAAGETRLDELGVSRIGQHDLAGAAGDPRPYLGQHASLLDWSAGAKVKRKGWLTFAFCLRIVRACCH